MPERDVRDPLELVLTGVRLYGVDDPSADAVAVAGGRIVAIGPSAEVRGSVSRTAEVRHLPGRLVLPGFQDAHVHPPQAGRNRLSVDLTDLPGADAYVAAVASYAAAHPEQEWIVGGGWSMEHFAGGTPTKELLDAVVPDRPVFLFNRDVHGAWANSAALRRAGIDATTPDPADGRIERSADGEPSGTLHEGAAYRVDERVVPPPSPDTLRRAILTAQEHLHSLGITGWQDAWVSPEAQAAYEQLAAERALTARVVGALWWDRNRGVEQIADLVERRGSASHATDPAVRFRPTSIKIMLDGVLENFTGAMLEPYCRGHGGSGDDGGTTGA